MCLRLVADQKQTTPATMPMMSAGPGSTKPEAGVIATSPATAPEIAPSTEGLPFDIHSANVQRERRRRRGDLRHRHRHAGRPLAPTAEPALKPNQPTHSSDAPITA